MHQGTETTAPAVWKKSLFLFSLLQNREKKILLSLMQNNAFQKLHKTVDETEQGDAQTRTM